MMAVVATVLFDPVVLNGLVTPAVFRKTMTAATHPSAARSTAGWVVAFHSTIQLLNSE